MNTSDTQRRRRGRLLLVGDDPVVADVEQFGRDCDRTIARAANLFDAVGEVINASPREGIDALLVSEAALDGISDEAIVALRKLDPAVRLVLIEASEHPNAQKSKSTNGPFDAVIHAPVDAVNLARAIDGGESGVDQRNGVDESIAQARPTVDISRPPDAESPARPSLGAASEASQDDPSEDLDVRTDGQMDVSRQSLGDTDVVDAIMRGGDVRELAIELIQQQTGWRDLRLEEDHSERPRQSAAGAAVEHDGVVYGSLVSSSADADDLRRWAAWLGRWLALDDAHRRLRYMAYHDDLTEAWNRRYFEQFLSETIKFAAERRRPVTVMVLDIDDFKHYNDAFGHAAGDEILRETVRLLTSVIRKGDRVCRIGGDEFAVIFADIEGPREPGSVHPENVEQIAQRFQDQVCKMRFPKLGRDAPATLSVSAGLATYPWDGQDAQSLLEHADQLALQSKQRGKNAITLGPGAQHLCKRPEQ